MPDLSRLLRRSAIAVVLLAAAAAAPAPTAEPGPQAINAWGRKVDVDAQVREQLGAKIAAKMGSADWLPIAFQILDLNGEILPRAYGFAALDLQCGERYYRADPGKTFEEYLAFLRTAEGQAWERTCVADQLNDPNVDPRKVDGLLATLEIGFMLPQILKAVQQSRAKDGLEGIPEKLTPAGAEKNPALSRQAFALANCLLRKAMEGLPLGTALTDPRVLQEPMAAASKSGVCSAPKPAAPAGR